MKISILIPCHNEEKSIRRCVESCLFQTRPADQILVVNDGSTDNSGEILKEFGDRIEVLTIPVATGNKSYAQERGLREVVGDVFIATDGDTILSSNFVEEIEKKFTERPDAAAVCGYVKSLKFNWLTACRELEYVIGQNLHKLAQSYIHSIFVIPGCAGAFKTELFKGEITFDHDTLTEDLDFTYKLHERYYEIVYAQKAVSYTQDPATLPSYINQMRRWYCGGWQNLRKHYSIVKKPNNALQLSLTYIEGLIFSVALFLFPVVDLRFFLFFMPPYLVFILILGGYAAVVRKRWDLFYYAPTYIVLIFINAFIFLEQFWVEIVLRRTNLVWFHPERREIA
jgi:cellulose synthase/poly-beta-1,6-N-acetylglucosamine synthase-like glycosyltransferase